MDLIPWLPFDITYEENDIEGLEEPPVAKKIEVGTQFKSMADFWMLISDTVIKNHYDI